VKKKLLNGTKPAPFELRKAENQFRKAEIDRISIARKQKKNRKYVFDTKLCSSLIQCCNEEFLYRTLIFIVQNQENKNSSANKYNYSTYFFRMYISHLI
jgi:hypothetical protein